MCCQKQCQKRLIRHVRRQALEVAGQSTVPAGKLHRALQVRVLEVSAVVWDVCVAMVVYRRITLFLLETRPPPERDRVLFLDAEIATVYHPLREVGGALARGVGRKHGKHRLGRGGASKLRR